MPPGDTVADIVALVVDVVPVPQGVDENPPPSKLDGDATVEVDIDEPIVDDMVELVDEPVAELPIGTYELVTVVHGMELTPPGSISVAPSEIPVGAPEVAVPSAFSGDVAPSAGAVETVCAWPATQLNNSATIVGSSRAIAVHPSELVPNRAVEVARPEQRETAGT